MYHCLTGKPPYESDTPLQTAFLHLKAEMPALSESIDSNLKTIITGTMAKDPKDRYPSMKSLRKDLERVAAKEKPLFKPPSPKQKSMLYPILIATSICLVAGLISAWYLNSNKTRPETPVAKKLIKPEEVKLPPADKLHTVDTTTLLSVVSLVGENSGWDLEERTRTNHTPSAFSGLAKVSDITKALIQKGNSNIQELTDGLYSKSGLVRKVCCDALKTIGISATPSLVDKIGKEGKTNKYVVELLQEFADESTPLLIDKAIETKGKEQYFLVRLIANIAATTKNDISNIKNLEQLALNAESEESRSLATLMLVRQKSPDKTTIDTLAKLLSSEKSATVREAAASSLGAILQERQFEAQIITALSRALNEDPVTRVRFSAAVNLGANCKIVDTKTLTPKANESDPFINQALLTALAMKDGPYSQSSESKVKALLEKNNPELTKADLQALYSFFHEKTKKRGHAFNLLESAYGEKHAGFTLPYLMSYLAKDDLANVPRTKYITEDIGRALFNMKKSNYPALAWLLKYKGENQKLFRDYFKQLNHLDLLEK